MTRPSPDAARRRASVPASASPLVTRGAECPEARTQEESAGLTRQAGPADLPWQLTRQRGQGAPPGISAAGFEGATRSLTDPAFPSARCVMLWIARREQGLMVRRVLDLVPDWRAGVEGVGSRVAVIGRRGPQWRRPAVIQVTEARALNSCKRQACHQPSAPEAERSDVAFAVLTRAPICNQTC
eukprot:8741337-Pyramimonas_sp.AAC.2